MKATKIIGAVAATLLLVAGCVDNYVSVEVLGAKPFELVPAEEEGFFFCVTPAPGGAEQQTQGWMDTSLGLSFTQPFEFRNNLPSNADPTARRLDTNTITIDRVVISYRGLPGQEDITSQLGAFDTAVPMTGVITSSGGRLAAPVPLIPANRGQAIRDSVLQEGDIVTIIATFSVEGRTNAGASIATGEIDFPITIGRGTDLCDDGRCACYVR